MRIVFLSYHYSPDIHSQQEWLERIHFYVGWSECLAKTNEVFRVDQINFVGNFTHNRIRYYCVDDGKKLNYFPRKLNRFVKDLHPDVVLISSFLYPWQLVQLRNCLGKNVRLIVQHHAEKPFRGIKKYMQRFASRMTDAFIFTSRETGRAWVKSKNLHTETKIHELVEVSSAFYPMDKETARQKTGITGSRVFLWVGRLNQNKDPLTAVNAFLAFAKNRPGSKLYMLYQTEELISEIRQMILSVSGNSSVVLAGKIEHSELLYWFNSADFYLSASHYEGSGTALCEAMSCGCIPVVTDIPSFRMMTGNSGLLYEPGNENALLSVLEQTEHIDMQEQRNRALHRFKNELSAEAICRKFQELVLSL
jgi:glycosyltransferase involved in cell wall biosynthesis